MNKIMDEQNDYFVCLFMFQTKIVAQIKRFNVMNSVSMHADVSVAGQSY